MPEKAPSPAARDTPAGSAAGAPVGHRLSIQPQGWQVACPPHATLREAAAAAGITLPTSCRNGTCRHCIAQLISGQVSYRVEWPGLSREEKQAGWTLPCVAVPQSDVMLDAPGATRLGQA